MSKAVSAARYLAAVQAGDAAGARAQLRSVPNPYRAMVAVAKAAHWPVRFPADLTTHDRAFVEKRGPSVPFVWHLGSDGTHIREVTPGDQGAREARNCSLPDWLAAVRQCYPDCRMFVWNGEQLQEVASDALVLEWAER